MFLVIVQLSRQRLITIGHYIHFAESFHVWVVVGVVETDVDIFQNRVVNWVSLRNWITHIEIIAFIFESKIIKKSCQDKPPKGVVWDAIPLLK